MISYALLFWCTNCWRILFFSWLHHIQEHLSRNHDKGNWTNHPDSPEQNCHVPNESNNGMLSNAVIIYIYIYILFHQQTGNKILNSSILTWLKVTQGTYWCSGFKLSVATPSSWCSWIPSSLFEHSSIFCTMLSPTVLSTKHCLQ